LYFLPGQNYYSLVRQYGREYIQEEFDLITHPVDKRENYIKRCIGIPGDELIIHEGEIYINEEKVPDEPGRKYKYYVTTTGEPLPDAFFDSLNILKTALTYNPVNSLYVLSLNTEKLKALREYPTVRSVKRYTEPMLSFQNQEVYPHSPDFRWTGDNFGPIRVPARGDSITLSHRTLPLYQRIIEVYEGNDLELKEDGFLLNGVPADHYRFSMDYYFVVGDNYHNSADSRYWGFVPEDHLLGKAVAVWFSVEPEKSVIDGLRKERIFSSIK
jgi:signal peptidase I